MVKLQLQQKLLLVLLRDIVMHNNICNKIIPKLRICGHTALLMTYLAYMHRKISDRDSTVHNGVYAQ